MLSRYINLEHSLKSMQSGRSAKMTLTGLAYELRDALSIADSILLCGFLHKSRRIHEIDCIERRISHLAQVSELKQSKA